MVVQCWGAESLVSGIDAVSNRDRRRLHEGKVCGGRGRRRASEQWVFDCMKGGLILDKTKPFGRLVSVSIRAAAELRSGYTSPCCVHLCEKITVIRNKERCTAAFLHPPGEFINGF